ncbi:hypothetical protein RCL1_000726 [Eukaryota sp. TZLM3-RCL]
MEDSIRDKRSFVDAWLFSLGEPASYDDQPEVVNYLYDLACTHKLSSSALNFTSKNIDNEISSLNGANHKLHNLLTLLKVTPAELQQNSRFSLNSLVESSLLLNIENPTIETILTVLSSLQLEVVHLEARFAQITSDLSRVDNLVSSVVSSHDSLNNTPSVSEITRVLQHDIAVETNMSEILSSKDATYVHRINDLKSTLRSTGIRTDLTHSAIVSLKAKLVELEESLLKNKRRLASFRGLPADDELAGAKLAELHQQVASLERRLSERLESII